jgi:hypothetical protein
MLSLGKGLHVYDTRQHMKKMIVPGIKILQGYNKYMSSDESSIFLLVNQREREWRELVTITFVELVLELHPVKPQCVKECTESLHDEQDADRGKHEDNDANNEDENIVIPTKKKHDILDRGVNVRREGGRDRGGSLLTPTLA